MTDDTRDALLMAVAEWILAVSPSQYDSAERRVRAVYDRARHEQERPEDRG